MFREFGVCVLVFRCVFVVLAEAELFVTPGVSEGCQHAVMGYVMCMWAFRYLAGGPQLRHRRP